jgi:hypothetical protein
VLIVENLPRVDESKQAKLQGFVTKVFSALGKIVEDGVYMPVNKETGTTEGCVPASGIPLRPHCPAHDPHAAALPPLRSRRTLRRLMRPCDSLCVPLPAASLLQLRFH